MKTEDTKGKWECWLNEKASYTIASNLGKRDEEIIAIVFPVEVEKDTLDITQAEVNATIICKSVNAYHELIQTLKDLQEVLIEAKLTIHAKGIEELLKKYE